MLTFTTDNLIPPLEIDEVDDEERPEEEGLLPNVRPLWERHHEAVPSPCYVPLALPLPHDTPAGGGVPSGIAAGEDVEDNVLATAAVEEGDLVGDGVGDAAGVVQDEEVVGAAAVGTAEL